jgi:hypothetical protein
MTTFGADSDPPFISVQIRAFDPDPNYRTEKRKKNV